jgi:glycosyltransferase involved in cell wall biosynthesis
MIPFLFWDEYSHRIPADYRYALKLACRRLERAPCIVTISQHSKNDIAEVTGYAHERIYVAYPGRPEELDNCKSAITDSRLNCTAPTDGGKPYFVYVGGTDVRKNVLFMIRAFARFAGREQDVQLVLVGDTFTMKSLPEVAEIFREIHSLGMADRVVTTGYVDEQRVRELYRGSVALIFPSLYEGFGLPVLEAMTYGAPVVAARTSSIPEVLGDTGIYFDPRDEDSLVTGMETVYGHPTRCGDLVERARQRARLFSWDTVADVVFGIYDQI